MEQHLSDVNKPGKFSVELCQVPMKVPKSEFPPPLVPLESLQMGVKAESQEIIQRLKEDLDSTQREVDALKSDVLRLKSEQKENEQVIQQLQQANKALYQRLDELQSRCDCMEDPTRRQKDAAERHSNLWYPLENSASLQTLSSNYSKLLQHPLQDFCMLFGDKHGVALFDALHGSRHKFETDVWSRDYHAEAFAIDLSRRHPMNVHGSYNYAEDQNPPMDLSTQSDLTVEDEACLPVDLSSKPSYSLYREDLCSERSSPDRHLDSGQAYNQDSESNGSDWPPPLQIDLGNVSDDEGSGKEKLESLQNDDLENEEENSVFISAMEDDELPEPSLSKISSCRRRKRGPKSWEFLMRLMADKRTNPSVIRWEDRDAATIRLIQPHFIAKLWGKRSSKPNLTYDHFARALRYHYKKGQLIKVSERQLVYGCGPQAISFLELLLQQNDCRSKLEIESMCYTEKVENIPQDHTYFYKKDIQG